MPLRSLIPADVLEDDSVRLARIDVWLLVDVVQ